MLLYGGVKCPLRYGFHGRSLYLCLGGTLGVERFALWIARQSNNILHFIIRMKRTTICFTLAALFMGNLCTQAQVLTRGKSYGTHPLTTPVLIDSVNLRKTSFDLTSFNKRPYEIEG